uniref:Anoctamin n=1 Tax=Petromyzon marinus TaxID=7757 RepID=A0AAJ7TV77_PETMA|nr:anoctamin-5-like [Petromyzon marinus]
MPISVFMFVRVYVCSGEICNNTIGGSLVMCPQCDQKCTFWRLNDTCETAKTSHMYENPVTIFFAVFMGLWATVFLEFWKRRQASLAYRWDLTAAAEEGDPIRPEYLARCTTTKCNIITMVMLSAVTTATTSLHTHTSVLYCCMCNCSLFS